MKADRQVRQVAGNLKASRKQFVVPGNCVYGVFKIQENYLALQRRPGRTSLESLQCFPLPRPLVGRELPPPKLSPLSASRFWTVVSAVECRQMLALT